MATDPIPGAKSRRVRPALFLRLDTDPVTRAWSGIGGFVLPPDGIETTGGRYLGVGWMRNLPVLDLLLNGRAESVSFTLAGVDDRTIQMIDDVDVEGVRAHLGLMFLGPGFARRPVRWFRRYRVDATGHTTVGLSPDDGGAAAVEMSASLTLGSTHTRRRIGHPTRWTHAEQSRLFPGDLGAVLVGRLGSDATRPWPPKD